MAKSTQPAGIRRVAPPTDAKEPRLASGLAGIWGALLTLGSGATTVALVEHNTEWIPAWVVVTLLYGVGSWGLLTRRHWSRAFGAGLSLFAVAACAQCVYALGPLPTTLVAGGVHVVWLLLLFFVRSAQTRREGLSMVAASVALMPAVGFALAPEQTGGVMIAVLAGAGILLLGTMGLARGRTWGLLLALVGAPVLAVSVLHAPSLSHFTGPHAFVGQPLQPLMLDALGVVAAAAAVGAVLPYLVPMVRFLFRPQPA